MGITWKLWLDPLAVKLAVASDRAMGRGLRLPVRVSLFPVSPRRRGKARRNRKEGEVHRGLVWFPGRRRNLRVRSSAKLRQERHAYRADAPPSSQAPPGPALKPLARGGVVSSAAQHAAPLELDGLRVAWFL